MRIAIVTDSTSDLPKEIIQALNIHVVPVYVNFGNKAYRDGIDLSADQFYQELVTNPVFPKTSQPTLADFKAVYEKLSQTFDGIISLHIASKLSGTFNAACQAKKQLESRCPIEIIDSQQAGGGLGIIVQTLAKASLQEYSMEKLLELSHTLIANTKTFCLINTLDFLVKGGRIGKAKGLIGNLINIKPIIKIEHGVISDYKKSRSFAMGIQTLIEIAKTHLPIAEVIVAANTEKEDAIALANTIQTILESKQPIPLYQFGPSIGAHIGPRAIGISFIKK